MDQTQKSETGYCVICGCHSSFRFDPTIITSQLQKAWGISDSLAEAFNRKESMFCSNCGGSLRIRRLAAVLIQTFSDICGKSCKSFVELLGDGEFQRVKIAEINACGALHSYLKKHANLYYSEWIPDVKPGEACEGIRCEDLQCLTYPDDYFDIILTSETFEHVPDPDQAWREIYRTLRSGGYHIFTIPVLPAQLHTTQRAKLVNGRREDLLEPAYHGDWGRESMFVYTDFGMDVLEKLNEIGLKTEVFYRNPDDELDVAVVFRSYKAEEHSEVAAKGPSPLLEGTGERYVPWMEGAEIGYEHLHRYAFASQFVQNKTVLDLACGEGYGSRLLARTAKSVVGIDIDEDTIRHARNKYLKNNLQFELGSITDVPLQGQHIFDVITCFEAIEHIEDHDKLLREVKRLLTSDGLFIVSTPNKWVYSDQPQYSNPFHVHELYFDEFKALLKSYFRQVKFLGQRIYCNSNMWPIFPEKDAHVSEFVVERTPHEFNFVETDKRIPLYFISVASDTTEDIGGKVSILVDSSNELHRQKDVAFNQVVAEREHLKAQASSLTQALGEKEEQLAQLTAERDQFGQTASQLQAAVQSQQLALGEKEREGAELTARRDTLSQEIGSLQAARQQREIEATQLVSDRERLAQEVVQLQVTTETQQRMLDAIEDSLAWILITRYQRLRERILPPKTLRRRIYDSVKDYWKLLLQRKPKEVEDSRSWRQIRRRQHGIELKPIHESVQEDNVIDHEKEGKLYGTLNEIEAAKIRSDIDRFKYMPVISVIMPVYNTPEKLLRLAIESVINQLYTNWELCVADDASTVPYIKTVLEEYKVRDSRIKVVFQEKNGNISAATNAALSLAQGEYVAMLDHDDELDPIALYEIANYLNENPEMDVIYTDHDKIDHDGKRQEPFFKPDWSPVYFLGVMYICHLLCVRRALALEVKGFASRFDGLQDYEFMLRLSEKTDRIGHIPKIVYHWRKLPGSIAASTSAKSGIDSLQQQAVQAYLERQGIPAKATPMGNHRIRLVPLEKTFFPLISIIIPSKDAPELLEECLKSVFTKSTYPNFEVIVGDNQTTDARALRIMQEYPVRRILYDAPYNFSRINNFCVQHASGDFLLFLNNDTEVLTPDWLEQMFFYAEQPSIGAVGAVLVYPNRSIQHAGVVLASRGTADHVARDFPDDSDGYYGSLRCAHEASAVTAACLMVKRSLFERVGSFNEHFVQIYQDVDLCLKFRQLGNRNIVTPQSRLVHKESASRGNLYDLIDRALLLDLWEEWILDGDPYYNPNLDLERLNYQPRP